MRSCSKASWMKSSSWTIAAAMTRCRWRRRCWACACMCMKKHWLLRQPKNLLPAGAGVGRGHRDHGAPGFSIYAEADSGDGLDHRQRPAPMRAGEPDSWRLFVAGRDADVEICREPFSDGGGKSAARREAFGISHGLPGVLKSAAAKAGAESGGELG